MPTFMLKTLTTPVIAALACLAAPVHAQQTFYTFGTSGFMQDLDPNDGVDYQSAFTGTWQASFTVPTQSGLTLISNVQSQGGSRTTYNGATLHSLTLQTPTGQLTVVSSNTPGRVILWDRAIFAGGTHYFDVAFTIGSTSITISVLASQDGPPPDAAYNQLFIVGTPNPNTLDSDWMPTFDGAAAGAALYRTTSITIDGQAPQMPGRGRYFGDMLYLGTVPVPTFGACCEPGGGCTFTSQSVCAEFWVSGAPCEPTPCDQPSGACCANSGACTVLSPTDCSDNGGTFEGANTVCSPSPCSPVAQTLEVEVIGDGRVVSSPTGIDCVADCQAPFDFGTMVILTALPNPGRVFAGWSGACTGVGACVVTMDDYQFVSATFGFCPADFNQSGSVTIQDIFEYLLAYFAGSPSADINGGGLSVQDLFDFLDLYFTPCV